MISIVFCSNNTENQKRIRKNIEDTIGIPYEIIEIENTKKKYGICEGYNLGAAQSNFSIICFLHEDILIHTPNWGGRLLQHFLDPTIGLIGLAGATSKTFMFSDWYFPKVNNIERNRFKYHISSKENNRYYYINPHDDLKSYVATLDGFFLAAKKAAWEKYPFDENLLKGFHGYDLDFSIGINQFFNVAVIYDVDVKHFSSGNYNYKWFKEIKKVHKKWKKHLPIHKQYVSRGEELAAERKTYKNIFRIFEKSQMNQTQKLKVLLSFLFHSFNFRKSGIIYKLVLSDLISVLFRQIRH